MAELEEVPAPVLRVRRRRSWPTMAAMALAAAAVALLGLIAVQGDSPPEWPQDVPCFDLTFYEGGATYGRGRESDISAQLCPRQPITAPSDDG